MDKKLSNEHEPSPELMEAFSDLVEREAYRKILLGDRRDGGRPAGTASCTAWQPHFKIEDFSCTVPIVLGHPEKSAGKPSPAAGAENGSREEEGPKRPVRKGVKRMREPSSIVAAVNGEKKLNKEEATREVMKWDLNKAVELFDDNN